MEKGLPPIPAKRYFTIGEVGDLCGVKPHVLRYWEQEFTQLRPMKRRGNRRYYQHHEVLMIRRIRDLLYEQGFTISGARNRLQEMSQEDRGIDADHLAEGSKEGVQRHFSTVDQRDGGGSAIPHSPTPMGISSQRLQLIRHELFEIRELLSVIPAESRAII